MSLLICEYPLKLPQGWEPTPMHVREVNPKFSRTLTIDEALRFLEDEVMALRPSFATLYTNYQQLNSERSRKKIGQSSGAGLLIKIHVEQYFLACDHWMDLEQNLYALHLAIHHLRSLEELGIATTGYAMSLFSTSPVSSAQKESAGLPEWMLKLGLGPSASLEDANAVYRRRAKMLVDDETQMMELNRAMEEARGRLV